MLTLTADISVVVDAVVQKLEYTMAQTGIEAVFYGDQNLLPVTPVACVEPDTKQAPLKGAQRVTDITFTVYILLYHSKVESPQSNRKDADQMARKVELILNSDPRLTNGDEGELLIHCWVSEVQSGYATRSNSVLRSSRLTLTAQSQEILSTPS